MTSNPTSEGASALLPTAAAPSTQDALQLLHADHRRIDAMLSDCERLAASDEASSADRSGLVSRLGALLIAHGQMEQQLFYPALRVARREIEQAEQAHADIARQLEQLSASGSSAAEFKERIAALAAAVRAHVSAEEAQLFAGAEGLDLHALGTSLAMRRGELLGEQGVD